MNENREIKIRVLPFEFFVPRRILNSLWSVVIIKFHRILNRDGINQNIGGIIRIPMNTLVQFRDKLKFVEGSNDEKRFAIIFNWRINYFFVFLMI